MGAIQTGGAHPVRSAVLILIALAIPALAAADTAHVVYSDGRPSESVEVMEMHGDYFVPLAEVARLLNLDKTIDAGEGKATLEADGHRLEVIIGGTVWLRDGEPVKAGEAAVWEEGTFYVSLESVEETLAPALERVFRWSPGSKQITVGLPSPNIVDLEVQTLQGRAVVTIRTVGLPHYDLTPMSGGRIEMLIRGGVSSKALEYDSKAGLIRSIRSRQTAGGAVVVVTLADNGLAYRVFPRWDPDGIVVSVWRKSASELPEPALRPPRQLAWPERFSPERAKVDVVVVDPGHGGENLGSVGPSGYTEKQANLEIARKLKDRLEAAGIEVFLTRNEDVFLSLERRTEIANSVEADLFISVHANGYRGSEARGFEVYFLSPALTEGDKSVAARENAGVDMSSFIAPGSSDEVAFILWDAAQNEFIVESSDLAQFVNEEMSLRLNIPNRGVKQSNFVVLTGAYLPAVLIETAFITNPAEESLLRDAAFQETVAEAISAGVLRFKGVYGR
jgi:N-acetylmuramoyl-L-alanine amidase